MRRLIRAKYREVPQKDMFFHAVSTVVVLGD